MTFEELPLYEAIHDVYPHVEDQRSDQWMTRAEKREWLCRQIQAKLPIGSPFLPEQMLSAWSLYGKSQAAEPPGNFKKIELTVMVARVHGKNCFYRGRAKGECSFDVSLDRILPGIRGGVYSVANCVIACRKHNSQRNDTPLEEFLNPQEAPT